MAIPIRRHLAHRQAGATILVALITGLLFSGAYLGYALLRENQRIGADISRIAALMNDAAVKAAYEIDGPQARRIVDGIFLHPSVSEVRLINDFGTVLARRSRSHRSGLPSWLVSALFGADRRYRFALYYGENRRLVGHLEMTADRHAIAGAFFHQAAFSLGVGLFRDIVLALILGLMFYFSITRPLLRISDRLSRISPGDPELTVAIPRGHQADELGMLAGSINQLLEQWDQSLSRLQRTQVELGKREARFRAIFETARDSIFIKDENLRYILVNPAMERLFQTSAQTLLQSSDEELFEPEAAAHSREVDEQVLAGEIVEEEHCKSIRGKPMTFHVIKVPLRDQADRITGLCGIARDLSHIKELETRIRQSQKIEAIGTLAGGIAHDFNNILGIIVGNAELALGKLSPEAPARRHLMAIQSASLRAKEMVLQLLRFSRKSEEVKKSLDLRPVIQEALGLLRATLPSNIEIRKQVAPDLPAVMADATQLHQLLINLCTNAHHAMEAGGGVLTVILDQQEVGETDKLPEPLHSGPYLRIRVADTGAGIPPEIQDRIFDPYFTTKETGQGTGMGLSVVHGIVKDHGGAIWVESQAGQGSAFTILLPAIEKAPESDAPSETAPVPGHERILLVDDEPHLTELLQAMLEHLGYTVDARTSPERALEVFSQNPQAFDLVITDMTMPQMTGDLLAKALIRIRPDIPVVLCTGYSEKTLENPPDMGIRARIAKPVQMGELSSRLREVLES